MTGAAESAFAARAGGKVVDEIEIDLQNRNHDELSQSVEWLNGVGLLAPIPGRNEDLPLIIRVDEADEIAQYDAIFVTQSRTRKDHGSQPRVGQMDGDAGRDKVGLAWLNGQRSVEAGS